MDISFTVINHKAILSLMKELSELRLQNKYSCDSVFLAKFFLRYYFEPL